MCAGSNLQKGILLTRMVGEFHALMKYSILDAYKE